jgi:hypothetical protein
MQTSFAIATRFNATGSQHVDVTSLALSLYDS